jgi:hypothetical protein
MQIAKVDVIPVEIPLITPVRMATHTITHAANVLVRMESTDGVVGWGEAAEAHNMTGDLQPGIAAAMQRLAAHYLEEDARRLRALARVADQAIFANTAAKSALDMARRHAGYRRQPVVDRRARDPVRPADGGRRARLPRTAVARHRHVGDGRHPRRDQPAAQRR